MRTIDLNCDLGEGCGHDGAIAPWITSASIACGAHAGDEATMRETLRLCTRHGIAAGAHPSYADRAHFGRREVDLPPAGVATLVRDQLASLDAIAREEGVALSHVKPHGALYNRAARDGTVADAIIAAVRAFDPSLAVMALAGSELARAGRRAGMHVLEEAFVERGYGADGHLLPRGTPGAVLEHSEEAARQARALAEGTLTAADGTALCIRADTLCLHGDRPDAAAFARAVREALESAGVRVAAPAGPR